MKTIALIALALVGCSSRPLVGPPCATKNAAACESGDWCVQTWGAEHSPFGFCAQQCATDADCESGTCQIIGDGATVDKDPLPRACK